MTETNGNTETVSETLEDAFAGSISRIQEFIEDAPGLDRGSPEQLAELVRLARSLEARTTSLWADIADDPDDETKAGNGTILDDDPLEAVDPRVVKAYPEIGLKKVRGGTTWLVPDDAPRTADELRFTRRSDTGFDWWKVKLADTDYCHVHEVHGRALAFEFLDYVNNPDREAEADHTLRCIARGMVNAAKGGDWRQEALADGFWGAIGEYLINGIAAR